jgi:hypothetical protein
MIALTPLPLYKQEGTVRNEFVEVIEPRSWVLRRPLCSFAWNLQYPSGRQVGALTTAHPCSLISPLVFRCHQCTLAAALRNAAGYPQYTEAALRRETIT